MVVEALLASLVDSSSIHDPQHAWFAQKQHRTEGHTSDEKGNQGDIFVKKSPSSTLDNLVKALFRLFKFEEKIKIIGTRHGEKLYESLISREEMSKADDLGGYFRIPADNRDLNYSKYFTEGRESISNFNDYTSHNADQLDVKQLMNLLSKLSFIKEKLSD